MINKGIWLSCFQLNCSHVAWNNILHTYQIRSNTISNLSSFLLLYPAITPATLQPPQRGLQIPALSAKRSANVLTNHHSHACIIGITRLKFFGHNVLLVHPWTSVIPLPTDWKADHATHGFGRLNLTSLRSILV